jgi:CO/xanthine dehydrogenase Mo-binding subunit
MTARANELLHVGNSMPGVDSRDKITGAAVYASDIVLDGMLHAKILRSPFAHARIRSIDAVAALTVDGVVAVATGADLASLDPYYGAFILDQPVLAIDKVRFAGEPVAAVAAADEAQAYRALERIRVDYEELPTLTTIEQALSEGAPPLFDRTHASTLTAAPPNSRFIQEPEPNVLFEYHYATGDAEALLRQCAYVFEDRFSFSRLSHFGLEPHVSLARADAGAAEVWSNNQDPFLLREDTARIFGLSLSHVRFHGGPIGGGFGAKSYCKIEPIAVLLARKTGRPVRLALTMAESMATVCEHAAEIRLRSGVSATGETIAREAVVLLDGGAYADASPSVAMRIGSRFAGPYVWRAVKATVKVVRTTTIPAGSFRGFGAGHVAWSSESQIDMIARRLGNDPCAMRLRNLASFGASNVPGETPVDSDLHAGLNAVADRIGYAEPRKPNCGVGLAVAIKSAGAAHRADASIRISGSGFVVAAAGVSEIGQSTRTVVTQIVAEALHVDPTCVTVGDIDTDSTPFDSGTHASCGLAVSGLAVAEAAQKARAAVLAFAASRLGCPPAELDFENFVVSYRDARYPLARLLADSQLAIGTEFRGESTKQTGRNAIFWMPSWTAAEVEVDAETGMYRVLRLVTAIDAGKAINPQRCQSQAEGAAVQGLGQAMFEQLAYADGAPLNADPLRYRVPRIADVPANFDALVLEHGQGPGPYGSKGIGEAGNLTIPAAIANAIADAIGARVTDLPITADKVWRARPLLDATNHLGRT